MVGKPLPRVEDLPIDEAVEKLEAELPERMRRARGGEGPGELGQGHEDLDRPARLGNLGARRGLRRAGPFDRRAHHRHREHIVSRNVRPGELERRLQQRLDALPPAARAELLHVLMLPDFERADRIGEFWGYPESRTFAELLIDCEGDRTLRPVLVGMLREADR
jgi:hypothetical protein